MATFEVKVLVHAEDIMQATVAQQGVQNILDELEEHQDFLIELSDRNVARKYKNQIMSIINNKLVKAIASKVLG
ncbi:MAG: hypothetical protein HGA42_00585 [Nostocales cyanobacterium W4_Combined_metabat2_030]|nr:hypothetical protein [Nostocales cyanobacterium W4_Combined_metabat2_030]